MKALNNKIQSSFTKIMKIKIVFNNINKEITYKNDIALQKSM